MLALSEPTEEALVRIADAHGNKGGPGIVFLDIHTLNACNHILSGTIEIGAETYGFIIESGDWNGTVVRAWGDPEDVGTYQPPPPPPPRTFVPIDGTICVTRPRLFEVYLYWRKQPWFKEKESEYNYDRFFHPGGLIEKHYDSWARQKGMRVGSMMDFEEDLNRAR